MSTPDIAAAIVARMQAEFDLLRSQKVVSLRRYSEIHAELMRAQMDHLLVELRALRIAVSQDAYLAQGRQLTDQIEEWCREYRVPDHRSPLWMARWLTARSWFWRESQKLRKWYAEFNDVSEVEVSAHVRHGRRVREHVRLLGYQHLLELQLGEHTVVVSEILRLIATGAHRSPHPGQGGDGLSG